MSFKIMHIIAGQSGKDKLMNMFGMTVVFGLGAFFGLFYAMLVGLGFISTTGRLHDSNGFDINAGTYYVCFMLIVPIIGVIVSVFLDPNPGAIGFALTSFSGTAYLAWGLYKQYLAEKEV